MKRENQNSEVFVKPSFWECDVCQRILKHGEFRFNCTICLDYNQCETCTEKMQPPHEHRLVREIAYGYAEEVECIRMDFATRLLSVIKKYELRYCLGMRDRDSNSPEHYTNSYSWFTFKSVGERIKNFSNGLRRFMEPRSYVGICSANRPEWMITDFACILQSFISVPIYCLSNDRDMNFIINNAALFAVVCDVAMLPRFIRLHSTCPSLKHIVCMDPIPQTISKAHSIDNNRISIHFMGTIERYGSMKKFETAITDPGDILTVVYTSGSSGFPKGVMISEHTFNKHFSSLVPSFREERIRFCYRPLSWMGDRRGSIQIFLEGGRTGFSTGDVSRLMEDLALVRPTSFSAPPIFWNKIYAEYRASLSLSITNDMTDADIAMIEERLLKKFATLIPQRCRLLSIGGAMFNTAVFDFMKRCFRHCTVMESYGATEVGSISYENLIDTEVNYRLESVPEIGYTTEDKPFPRGELLVKTTSMFSGYLNNPEETRMALTDDGFFRTGDIVELSHDSKTGMSNVKVIDRKKNFFKLAHGQFVSPESLQQIYAQSLFIEQIYIHGNPLENSVTAVIVPSKEQIEVFAIQYNIPKLDNDHPSELFYSAIMDDLHSIALKESLPKHEIPSKVIIDFEPFTVENGLLTSSMKLSRYLLAAKYGERLQVVRSIEDRLKDIIEKAIGRRLTSDQTTDLASIGGGSLATVRLSRMIHDDLGVSIPLDILFKSDTNLNTLVNMITDPSQILLATDEVIVRLLRDSQQELHITVGKTKMDGRSPEAIFITGATGFVGAFLLVELIKVCSPHCKFVCLVRCQSSENPLDRIEENMKFLQLWNEQFRDCIIALRGDLSQEHFGLDAGSYSALANRIDMIFHCGATVNFVFPYDKLYGANVNGTLEVIRLATYNTTCIPVQYISTMSVLPSDINDEVPIDEVFPKHLKIGYGQSKWVAEKLMAKANLLGLPVNIFRLGSIWASSETGACNQHDIHTLLLVAMIKTSCYPITALRMNLNGVPVNLAAQSIVSLCCTQPNFHNKTYHIVPSCEGISLKRIIENMNNCGHLLTGVSYDDWKVKLMSESMTKPHYESVLAFFTNNTFERSSTVPCHSNSSLIFPSINDIYITNYLTFILSKIIH